MTNVQESFSSFTFDMNDSKFSDIKIASNNGIKFNLHRVILAHRSVFFSKLFDGIALGLNSWKFDESSEVLKNIFSFIYSGTIDQNCNDFKSFAIAAKKFEIIELMKLCENKIKMSFKIENAVDLLIFASDFNASMEKDVLNFIAKHAKNVRDSEGWKLLDLAQHKNLKIKLLDVIIESENDDAECWKIDIDYQLFNSLSKCSLVVKPTDKIAWMKKAFLRVKIEFPLNRSFDFLSKDKKLEDSDIVSNVLNNYDCISAKFTTTTLPKASPSPLNRKRFAVQFIQTNDPNSPKVVRMHQLH